MSSRVCFTFSVTCQDFQLKERKACLNTLYVSYKNLPSSLARALSWATSITYSWYNSTIAFNCSILGHLSCSLDSERLTTGLSFYREPVAESIFTFLLLTYHLVRAKTTTLLPNLRHYRNKPFLSVTSAIRKNPEPIQRQYKGGKWNSSQFLSCLLKQSASNNNYSLPKSQWPIALARGD